ncbi:MULTISPECIES: ArsR/SmtB family transcription factor [Agrobacterium]|jgi:ArsR family transcriptional regulator|uniref:Helix-turn-helix transcriptional regulator n=1 Tax=Agrobacterium burrii TaxID=2815339 RepID=A0ABS3ECH6_9HYPH|nr:MULTISPECIES: metalloregulator ArsR/SmtB family transcription factor [Agrobacterium]MQB09240.1 transcriptional regulator [Agrobacterium sp. ICMP 6402]MBO0129654.1 helix-turn-helix transcriptional regulator [Agrobacterium burrii]MDH0614124.1 metalloregulator ArsR/SmtB family transcription factor [Agrobacterium sp. GD03872]MDH0695581.1 metalloregulator ArsR/SmtB family transcription factor [Agrobacterium sp. GD03871]MDH1058483.1 metalloregulator ArsR/SmtB family transcription factor [Agrobact
MEERQALSSFAALSQETRLAIVRALVVAGPEGLAAGVIAERMGVSATNVSFHLKELERSGLISQRRVSRSILYSANYEALADLVKFLMEDCCAGHPVIRENVERNDGCCNLAETLTDGDNVIA